MADWINWKIDVDDTKLRLALDDLPDHLKAALRVTITKQTNQLLRAVQAREPLRTGRLRQQTHAYIDERQNWLRGRVRILPVRQGINRTAAAFGALEYGGPGTSGRRTGKVRVRWYSRNGIGVGTYERRRPTIRARRFLRGSAAALLPLFRAELEQTVNQTMRGALKS